MPSIKCSNKQCERVIPVVASRITRTKYCCKSCRDTARENKVEHTCAYPLCKKTFWDKASNLRKYCSRECFYDDRSIPVKPLPIGELERSQIEALIIQYKALVKRVAEKLYFQLMPVNMDFDDFLQEGYAGLIEAYQQNKDDSKSFTSYARKYVYYAILQAWREKDHTIRLPESLFRKEAKVTPEQLEQFKRNTMSISLEAADPRKKKVSHSGQRGPFSSPTETEAIRIEQMRELYQALNALIPKQCLLVSEHYGLNGNEEVAMNQLSIKFTIPKVTTFRLVHRGLAQLKDSLLTQQ